MDGWASKKLLRQLPISDAVRLLQLHFRPPPLTTATTTSKPHCLPIWLPRSLVSHSFIQRGTKFNSHVLRRQRDWVAHPLRHLEPTSSRLPAACCRFPKWETRYSVTEHSKSCTPHLLCYFAFSLRLDLILIPLQRASRLQHNLDHPHAYPIAHDPTTEFKFHQLPR